MDRGVGENGYRYKDPGLGRIERTDEYIKYPGGYGDQVRTDTKLRYTGMQGEYERTVEY